MPAKFVFRLTKTKEVFVSLSAFIINYMFELVTQLFSLENQSKMTQLCNRKSMFTSTECGVLYNKMFEEKRRNYSKFSLEDIVS